MTFSASDGKHFILSAEYSSRLNMVIVIDMVIMIDMVSVQNLLAPFCCVLEKDTVRHFPLLAGLGKQL